MNRIKINLVRNRRKMRVRHKISLAPLPKMSVFRSSKHIYAQVIDKSGAVVASASTIDKRFIDKIEKSWDCASAFAIGQIVGKLSIENGVSRVVFDRGCYLYHGRVKALADGARDSGLIL